MWRDFRGITLDLTRCTLVGVYVYAGGEAVACLVVVTPPAG